MRTWLFHPVVFYPLAAILAVLVIAISVRPLAWPRSPAPVSGQVAGGSLILSQTSFDAPVSDTDAQNLFVTRNFWGQAQALRIAVHPNMSSPTVTDHGVQVLLVPGEAAQLAGHPATIQVTYSPLAVNAATGLAVSLQGAGPTVWVSQDAPPQHGILRLEVPAQTGVRAIGLRAISTNANQREAYGLEITRISITPHP